METVSVEGGATNNLASPVPAATTVLASPSSVMTPSGDSAAIAPGGSEAVTADESYRALAQQLGQSFLSLNSDASLGSCDYCRRMHSSCVGRPACTQCVAKNQPCIFTPKRKPGPPRGFKRKKGDSEFDSESPSSLKAGTGKKGGRSSKDEGSKKKGKNKKDKTKKKSKKGKTKQSGDDKKKEVAAAITSSLNSGNAAYLQQNQLLSAKLLASIEGKIKPYSPSDQLYDATGPSLYPNATPSLNDAHSMALSCYGGMIAGHNIPHPQEVTISPFDNYFHIDPNSEWFSSQIPGPLPSVPAAPPIQQFVGNSQVQAYSVPHPGGSGGAQLEPSLGDQTSEEDNSLTSEIGIGILVANTLNSNSNSNASSNTNSSSHRDSSIVVHPYSVYLTCYRRLWSDDPMCCFGCFTEPPPLESVLPLESVATFDGHLKRMRLLCVLGIGALGIRDKLAAFNLAEKANQSCREFLQQQLRTIATKPEKAESLAHSLIDFVILNQALGSHEKAHSYALIGHQLLRKIKFGASNQTEPVTSQSARTVWALSIFYVFTMPSLSSSERRAEEEHLLNIAIHCEPLVNLWIYFSMTCAHVLEATSYDPHCSPPNLVLLSRLVSNGEELASKLVTLPNFSRSPLAKAYIAIFQGMKAVITWLAEDFQTAGVQAAAAARNLVACSCDVNPIFFPVPVALAFVSKILKLVGHPTQLQPCYQALDEWERSLPMLNLLRPGLRMDVPGTQAWFPRIARRFSASQPSARWLLNRNLNFSLNSCTVSEIRGFLEDLLRSVDGPPPAPQSPNPHLYAPPSPFLFSSFDINHNPAYFFQTANLASPPYFNTNNSGMTPPQGSTNNSPNHSQREMMPPTTEYLLCSPQFSSSAFLDPTLSNTFTDS